MHPRHVTPPYDWSALLDLIRTEFAYMKARIDPPSSMHRLSVERIAQQSRTGEIWVIEDAGNPVACLFLTPTVQSLYLGNLAVARGHRGKGLARALVDLAVTRARALDLPCVTLQTRIELVENHAAFAAMGFAKTGETAHEGYDRPTSITMQRPLKG